MSNRKNLCLKCGLCCDGSIFTHANLKKNEKIDNTIKAGFKIFNVDGKKAFHLPCVYQKNKKCGEYNKTRPNVCKDFQCSLLRQYSRNEIKWEEALLILQSIFNHKQRLEKKLNSTPHLHDQDASLIAKCNSITRSEEYKKNPAMFRKIHADLLLESVTFSMRIEKYLQKKPPRDKN